MKPIRGLMRVVFRLVAGATLLDLLVGQVGIEAEFLDA
jgi:hypothetical protein